MKIQTHGGRCCGIKTIHGFHDRPACPIGPKKAQKFVNDTDVCGNSVSKHYNWYRPARPRETYGQRFDEYIRYIKEKRPAGLIEVTLLEYQLGDGWRSYLDKHGFKQVSEFFNSNSYDTVYVFHLVYGLDLRDEEPYDDYDDYEGED